MENEDTVSEKIMFTPILEEWIQENMRTIEEGTYLEIPIGMRTGHIKQQVTITISDDAEAFESDWRYQSNTFPSRIKALAQALYNQGILGSYRTSHYSGVLSLQKII